MGQILQDGENGCFMSNMYCVSLIALVSKVENKILQFVPSPGCVGQPCHLPGDHQE